MLQVGDQALIDILALCAYLKVPTQWPAALTVTAAQQTAIVDAATALEGKVQALVKRAFQSPPHLTGEPPYWGSPPSTSPTASTATISLS